MTKNIIAQTRAAVQFKAHPINRMRQLQQLSRLTPDFYERITGNMKRFPGLDYGQHITGAMKQILVGQNGLVVSGMNGPEKNRSVLVNAAQPNGAATEIVQVPGADRPLYDLLIASKKYGYGSTTNANAPIEWWKMAGCEKQTPPREVSLTDPAIQKHLEAYELVDVEIQPNRIIRKYRKLEQTP